MAQNNSQKSTMVSKFLANSRREINWPTFGYQHYSLVGGNYLSP